MTKQTRARAIECQQWAEYYAAQAAIYRQSAGNHDGCPYRAKAEGYQYLAKINAATARAILAD